MPFSVRFGVCLVCLAVLLILPEQGRPQCYSAMPRTPSIEIPCCTNTSKFLVRETISSCFEQSETRSYRCKVHAFIFTTENKKQYCVDPEAKWLRRRFQILQDKGTCCYRF